MVWLKLACEVDKRQCALPPPNGGVGQIKNRCTGNRPGTAAGNSMVGSGLSPTGQLRICPAPPAPRPGALFLTPIRPDIPATPSATARPGSVPLRVAPAGLPDPNLQPPTIAESGDPFGQVRILELTARLERGQPIRIADIAA